MKRHKHWWEGIGLVLGILLLILVARTLLNVQPPAASEPAENTATAVLPSATPAAEATTTVAATQALPASVEVTETTALPLCGFPAFTESGSVVSSAIYTLSEPRVIMTGETPLDIAGWLPDGERLLLARDTQDGREIIETFNVTNNERRVYAERRGSHGVPVWLPGLESVAYATLVDDHYELWMSDGNPDATTVIATSVNGASLTTYGTQMAYFTRERDWDRLQLWDAVTRNAAREWLDMSGAFEPDTPGMADLDPPRARVFKAAWQPTGEHIAFYGHTRLVLLNTQTSQLCRIDLESLEGSERRVVYARWSPDGRYLAIMSPLYFPHEQWAFTKYLVILDMKTGDLHMMRSDVVHIQDIAWLNDGQALVMLGLMKEESEKGRAQYRLFMGNVADDVFRPVLPDYFFGTGSGLGWLISPSPTTEAIAVKCSIWREERLGILEDRLCLIDFSTHP